MDRSRSAASSTWRAGRSPALSVQWPGRSSWPLRPGRARLARALPRLAVLAVALLPLARRAPENGCDGERLRVRDALRVLRRPEVFRWLFLVEIADPARRAPGVRRPLLRRRGRHLVGHGGPGRRRPDRSGSRGGGDHPPASTRRRAALPPRQRGRERPLRGVPGRAHAGAKLALLAAIAIVNAGWPGSPGPSVRSARRGQRSRADGRRLPAERCSASRDRGARRAVGPRPPLAPARSTARAHRLRRSS